MHLNLKQVALTAALLQALSVHADSVDEAVVIVTATRFADADPRVPANISVITRDDIRNTPALGLPEILRLRAGVDVRPLYGSFGVDATVDLRGFGDTATSNTLVLLDGQRLNPIDMGSISWSAIPLESIRRIEIIRGAGTVLYGDRASGGVINIITDKSGSPRASVAASAGSHGSRGVDAFLAGGGGDGYFNLAAHYAAADGWRQNSQQDQQTLSGRVGLRFARYETFVDYALYKDSSGLPGFLSSAAYQADPRAAGSPTNYQRRDGYRLRPGAIFDFDSTLTLEAEMAVEHENQDFYFGSPSRRAKDTLSITPRLRWRHNLGNLPSETVAGFDYYAGDVDARYATAPGQTADQTSKAFYFQNSTQFSDAWTVTLGARNQRMEQRVHQDAYAPWFSAAMNGDSVRSRDAYDLGAAYGGAGWRAYAKLGTTFRFANTDELFGYDPLTFNPLFAGNLKPQYGTVREIGGSFGTDLVRAKAAIYRMDLNDEIGYNGAVVGPTGSNINFDPTRRQGLEAEFEWRPAAALKARIAYAYTNAEFSGGAYAGNDLPLVPRHRGSIQLAWDRGTGNSYAAVANYVGERRYSNDFDNIRGMLSGYATLDLQGNWKIDSWQITARMLNALDKRYAPIAGYATYLVPPDHYYYPADGRGIHLGARYTFK